MRAARVRGNACTRARVHFLWVRGKWHDKRMARARCMNEAWVCMEAVHGADEPGGALGALGVQEDTRHVSKRMYEIASYHVRNEAWWQVPVCVVRPRPLRCR